MKASVGVNYFACRIWEKPADYRKNRLCHIFRLTEGHIREVYPRDHLRLYRPGGDTVDADTGGL